MNNIVMKKIGICHMYCCQNEIITCFYVPRHDMKKSIKKKLRKYKNKDIYGIDFVFSFLRKYHRLDVTKDEY